MEIQLQHVRKKAPIRVLLCYGEPLLPELIWIPCHVPENRSTVVWHHDSEKIVVEGVLNLLLFDCSN